MNDARSERRVFLGMPGYGKQTAAAGRGFWRACADMSGVWNAYQNGSLLASNFNQLWCAALNLVHQGGQLDYFAMLHDDIGPEDYWLDKLIDELEANQLDVLGVVVPIKDTRGMTSLALHAYGDNWMPAARLSMHDVFELPETFTSDDLDQPVLLNTGCWVAKWNQEWCKKVHFEINDRIIFNTACNRYQAQTEPEDWFFSRQLHEIGSGPSAHLRPLRIGATRKIKVMHQGEMHFSNEQPWGSQAFDRESVRVSPVPNAWPFDIHGWLKPEEGKTLAELARGNRVLEIGSYCGLSTICMARTAEHVTAVDYFDGRGTPNPRDTLDEFKANIHRYGVSEKVRICHPDDPYPLPEYDLAFIDGAHDYPSVSADIERTLAVLAPGGVLAFHDYRRPVYPDHGVDQAVDELLANGGELLSVHETLAVVRPPAAIPLEV
jgi:predicted O-methyltransferase YrrM